MLKNWIKQKYTRLLYKRRVKAQAKHSVREMFKFFYEKYDLNHTNLGKIKIPYIGFNCRSPDFKGTCTTLSDMPGYSSIDINFDLLYNGVSNIFAEYNHYAEDPEIGHIKITSWQEYIIVLAAHEIAHSFEMFLVNTARIKSQRSIFPRRIKIKNEELRRLYSLALQEREANKGNYHGKLFQEIYRIFRKEFCNFEQRNYQ